MSFVHQTISNGSLRILSKVHHKNSPGFSFVVEDTLATMVVVAVAGGSGHVERTIVETLIEIGEHELIVVEKPA